MDKINILNISIFKTTEKELLENMQNGIFITPNLDHLVKLQKDKAFWNVYKNANWVICDSKILYLVLKLIGRSVPEPIPGSSFFTAFYKYHKDDLNCKIFLLGAAEGVAKKAMDNINKACGRNIVVGALSPSYGFENNQKECDNIADIIKQSGANVVLVGVGAPKQEKWIMDHKESMPKVKLWMALGATIDFEAGNIKRAPKIFQKLALEWLYRMYCEPKRMFKRYICNDLAFFWYLFKDIIGIYRNPFENNKC